MSKKEELIKNIIKKYNQDNINSTDKVYLEKPALENEEPFFIEFKKEINKSIFEKKNKRYQKKDKNKNQLLNKEIKIEKEEFLDKNISNKIEIEVKEILKKINIGLFIYKKRELTKTITDNILKNYTDLNANKKQKIEELVNNLIEYEIEEYLLKDLERKDKELLKFILNKILPEIEKFYKNNTYEKINKLSIFQKHFLINSFVEYLEKKYLKEEIKNKNISEKEYDFLKSKIKAFIIKQENIFKEINNLKRLNKKNEKS